MVQTSPVPSLSDQRKTSANRNLPGMLKNTEKREENLVLHNLLSICVYNYLITVPVIHIRHNGRFIQVKKKLARLRFLKFKPANVDLKVAQSPGEPSSHRETSGVRQQMKRFTFSLDDMVALTRRIPAKAAIPSGRFPVTSDTIVDMFIELN
ncbi:hypothetical protein GEV33_005253 [Tenebrio molitor]|uniref:Uncharacterized protein n=1 Tax=Tenebrio molitor TaxID=7067 RepID=A0A8J6LFR3_TENMO|nr:hypothetical protein GEV33_005253 [Tenebrio molitor]